MTGKDRDDRLMLIRTIQEIRKSRLVAYLTGDRQGTPQGQIAPDAVRPMFDHLRVLGFTRVPAIDLFLYSQGGRIAVPWRLVTMLRECCERLSVLVPYKAHSAATLIALGADEIIMCKKGELGPIDPILAPVETGQERGARDAMSIEDVMAYIAFLKERAGLSDQAALAGTVNVLAEQLKPWMVGQIYRTHSHIRLIARKLLVSHQEALEERVIESIVESLAEKMYFHGHAIGRKEAKEIGLPVFEPDETLEGNMWELLERYEHLLDLDDPIDPKGAIPQGVDESEQAVILACIESEERLDLYRGTVKWRRVREMPPQLNLNVNLGLQLPPGISPQEVPAKLQEMIQNTMNQLRGQIPAMIQAELEQQAPTKSIQGALFNASWQDATAEGI